MSTFEFVTILLSIVVGLGFTSLLSGFGRAIELRGQLKIYWVQVIWSINVGFYLVMFWWAIIFSYSELKSWQFINFANLFFYAILLYLQAALIIPSKLESGADLEAHFFSIRKWFFSIGALIPLIELLDTLMHGLDNLLEYGFIYIFMQATGFAFAVIAMFTKNKIFHGIWCLVYLASIVTWVVTRFWSIG